MVARDTALQTRGLTKEFRGRRGESTVALEDIDLHVDRGEFVCLVGASGCGKSTLLNIIAGLIEPSEGEALLDGLPIGGPSPDRGLVSQGYSLLPWKTVAKNISFGLELAGWKQGRASGVRRVPPGGHATHEVGRRPAQRALGRDAAACRHCPFARPAT